MSKIFLSNVLIFRINACDVHLNSTELISHIIALFSSLSLLTATAAVLNKLFVSLQVKCRIGMIWLVEMKNLFPLFNLIMLKYTCASRQYLLKGHDDTK